MANYPSSLPPWPAPITNQLHDIYLRFQTDVGPGKMRRRYTAQGRDINFTQRMTGEDYATIRDFHLNNAQFTYNDPYSDVIATFRWNSAPDDTLVVGAENPADRIYDVTLNLERLP